MEVDNTMLWFSILIYMSYEDIIKLDISKKILENNNKINKIIKTNYKITDKKILETFSLAFTLTLYFSSLKSN
jgi:hypothetical protein